MIYPERSSSRDGNSEDSEGQTGENRWTKLKLFQFESWCRFTKETICLESTLNGRYKLFCAAGMFGFIAYCCCVATLVNSVGLEHTQFTTLKIVNISVFGTFTFLHTFNAALSSCPSTMTSSAFGATISTIGLISHALHLMNLSPHVHNAFGRQISLIQFGEWIFCVPLLVMALGHILCLEFKFLCYVSLAQCACILFGLAANLVPIQAFSGFLLFISMGLLVPLWILLYILCFKLANLISSTQKRNIQFLGLSVIILWTLFPIVFFIGMADLISHQEEHILLECCDVLSKAFFLALTMLYGFEQLILKNSTRLVTLQKKESSQKLFLRFVFHEVRVPFHAVLLGLEHLEEQEELRSFSPLLETLLSSAKMMDRVINDVLSLSRLEDGCLNLEPAPFSLSKLVQKTTDSFREISKSKNIELRTECDTNLPLTLLGDQHRISQILANLISNAIKFSKRDKVVWITVDVVDQNQSCCCFKIKVRDQGIGISQEDQSTLFMPYVQIKPHQNQDGHGSGLGLSIVKHLVNLHDGTIKLQSEPGKGAEFAVTLKLAIIPPRELNQQEEKSEMPSYSSKNREWNAPWSGQQMLEESMQSLEQNAVQHSLLSSMSGQRMVEESIQECRRCSVSGQLKAEESIQESKRSEPSTLPLDFSADLEQGHHGEIPRQPERSKSTCLSSLPKEKIMSYRSFIILVVDDSTSNRKMTSMILTNQGFQTEEAEDGVEAVAMVQKKHYDLIIMDNVMPHMNGIEAAKEISSFSPVPIIGLTGNCLDSDVQAFISAGATNVLIKPCGKNVLIKTVQNTLHRTQQHPFI